MHRCHAWEYDWSLIVCPHTRPQKPINWIGMVFFITDCGKNTCHCHHFWSPMQENTRGSSHPHGTRGGGWWKTKPLVRRGWCETSKEVWSKPPWGYAAGQKRQPKASWGDGRPRGWEGGVQHDQRPCGWGTTSYIWLRLLSDHNGKITQMIIMWCLLLH